LQILASIEDRIEAFERGEIKAVSASKAFDAAARGKP